MSFTKIYRITYLIKLVLEKKYLDFNDWEDLDVDYDINRKTITRDVKELKELLYDIYNCHLSYDRIEKKYYLIEL